MKTLQWTHVQFLIFYWNVTTCIRPDPHPFARTWDPHPCLKHVFLHPGDFYDFLLEPCSWADQSNSFAQHPGQIMQQNSYQMPFTSNTIAQFTNNVLSPTFGKSPSWSIRFNLPHIKQLTNLTKYWCPILLVLGNTIVIIFHLNCLHKKDFGYNLSFIFTLYMGNITPVGNKK